MCTPPGSIRAIIPSSFPLRPRVCVSGHGWWQTGNSSPAHPFKPATQLQTNTEKHTWTHTLTHTHKHPHIHNRETKQIRKFFIFVPRYYLLLFCSPCVFMSCHLVKRLYGLHRPHGYECGEVDCGSFRTPSGPALSASDKRASPEGFTLQTGKLFNLTSSPILYLFSFRLFLEV